MIRHGMIRHAHRSRVFSRLVAVALALGAVSPATAPRAHADAVTMSSDAGRSGWDPDEPGLSPGAASDSDFGQLYSTALTGQIYAQPLVVGSTVIAATEENYVYGLDRATGAVKWSAHFGPAWPSSTIDCDDLAPDVGVTSTPVYDPSSGYLYATAKVDDGATANDPHYYLHALDVNTGAERPGWPVVIEGSPSNDPSNTFAARDELQRAGLLLQNGAVYLGFGGLCDTRPFQGYVVGVNTSTRAQHLWTTEAGRNVSGGSVWQSGGGIASDGNGGMFVATGNGTSAPAGPGASPPATLAESVIHLSVAPDGTIRAKDFFAPAEASVLDAVDADLGSGGPVALPDAEFGTGAVPHLMAEIGKQGKLYLLNRDDLGGRAQGPGGGDQVLSETQLPDAWGHPAAWGGDGGYVYVTEKSGYLVALGYGRTASGSPTLRLAANSAELFGYGSGSPVVTSDGTASGSAVVWVIRSASGDAGGQLLAYDAEPANRALKLLRSWPLGATSKFSVPGTDNGNVYVGTRDGNLIAFGLPTNPALQGSPTAFGKVGVGTSGAATAVLTATKTVTVSAITAAAPFALATPAPSLPVTLTAGQTLSVPVTFVPATWGTTRGQLHLATDAGAIDLGLSGTGTQPGLASSPASLDYGATGIGSSRTLTVRVQNTGASAETFTGVTAPGAPFPARALPAAGDTLAPGAAETISVTYAPNAVANDDSSIVLTSDQGSVTIPVAGAAQIARDQVTVSPMSISFGAVAFGQSSAPQSFTVTNTGNVTATVTDAAQPVGAFTTLNPIPQGLRLAPGESVTVATTFAPAEPANYSGTYAITTDTGQGPITVNLSGTCPIPQRVPLASPGGGWTLNGSARMSGTDLELSPSGTHESGDAVDGTPIPSAGLTAAFTTRLNGGGTGDGLTFSLLDAANSTPTSLGGADDGLGFSGLSGVAVVLGTHRQPGVRSDNFVGIATTTPGHGDRLTYLAVSTNVPPLRTGAHTVSVQVTGDQLDVSVDGAPVLSPTVALPASVLPAFTAGTGRGGARHVVSGVTIESGGAGVPPPGGGWSYNGSASASGPDTELTSNAPRLSGAVTYAQPLQINSMALEFTTVISGSGNRCGDGGLTFSLFDASAASASSVGRGGQGLGAAGVPGLSVTLNTETGGKPVPSVAIAAESASGAVPDVQFANPVIPSLSGTHTWWVLATGGDIVVTMDGAVVLRGNVELPASALASFTASTGRGGATHIVRDVSLWFR
jgi:hypothetical protein